MIGALDEALGKLGWIAGRNLSVERRWGAGDPRRIEAFAKELVSLRPDMIVGYTTPTVAALFKETDTIPIVFVAVSDPIGSGFIADYAHPGGHITGFTTNEPSMVGKWAALIKEIAPGTSRFAYLFNPETAPYIERYYRPSLEASARTFNMQSSAIAVHSLPDIESAIETLGRQPGTGLIVMPDSFNILHHGRIASLTVQHRLPAISPYGFMVSEGGLISYGVDQVDLFRRAAGYVDRILNGAKAAELPVQAPTKFELVVNMKTAKAMGITVAPSLVIAADEVIE